MNDIFQNHIPGLKSPAIQLEAVTPADGQDLDFVSRAIAVAARTLSASPP